MSKKRIGILTSEFQAFPLAQIQEQQPHWEMVRLKDLEKARTLSCDAYLIGQEWIGPELDVFFDVKRKEQPQCVHFLWTNTRAWEFKHQPFALPPQILLQSWGSDMLISEMLRAFLVASLLKEPAIQELIPKMATIPSQPAIYTEMLRQLQSPDADISNIAQLISNDLGLSAKILQLVNSSYYGLANPVTSAFDGVMYLGIEPTKALVLFFKFASQYDANKCPHFSYEELWQHSLETASMARWIMREESRSEAMVHSAYTAGFLHDLGQLMLAANLPLVYNQALIRAETNQCPIWKIEEQVFRVTHAQLAACQLGIWGLPAPIIKAIAWHHQPVQCPDEQISPLTAVHVANAFQSAKQEARAIPPPEIDLNYLEKIGAMDRLERWKILCGVESPEKS